MDQNLFRYIWKNTRRDQIWILCVVVLSMPTYFLFFDLPKQIVNGPIQGQGFEVEGATARFMEISFGVPTWISASGRLEIFKGIELERFDYLVALCLVFLLLVCINGLFKFYINTFKGRLGEQTLRRLRYDLVDRILRFPSAHVRRMKAPEAATMIKDEIEPMGGFIGEAYVQPAFLGGQAITAMAFILLQSFWLGLIAAGIVLAQAFIIPRLRRRLVELNRQRQLVARELAGRVGEIVDGISEVHVNDASNYERADISSRLGHIFAIRYELYQRKFFIKFLNNFLAQVTPFLFFLIGGFFAITGAMNIGQLVAVITAYKDLPSPIRELINWDQRRLDVQTKYTQVIAQFIIDDIMDPEKQAPVTDDVDPLTGEISISNLSVTDDTGAKLIERSSFKLPPGQRTAVLGQVNSGAEATAEVLAGLLTPTSGYVQIGAKSLEDLPESVTGRRIGYVGQDPYFRQTSVRETLLYGLQHAPLLEHEYDAAGQPDRARYVARAKMAGNSTADLNADWIDYKSAGVADRAALDTEIQKIMELVDLAEDIFSLGLRGLIDTTEDPELSARIIEARNLLRERLQARDLQQLVEPFDPDSYNNQATIAENLLFGTAIGEEFAEDKLANHEHVNAVFAKTGLDDTLFDMGQKIASTVIELFSDLPPDHPFFEQLSFMDAHDIPEYEAVLARVSGVQHDQISLEDRAQLFRLPFAYIEQQHRLSLLDDALKQTLLEARKTFRETLPEDLEASIEFYDPEQYNSASTLQDNILLGRIATGIADGANRVNEEIQAVLKELGLRPAVFGVGLDFNVGVGGKRFSASQRQKLELARAMLKRPDILVVNRIFGNLDMSSQLKIIGDVLEQAATLHDGRPASVFWVIGNAGLTAPFEEILVFEDGKLQEQGTAEELLKKAGVYARMTGQS